MGKNMLYFRPKTRPKLKTDQDVARQLETMTPEQLAEGINNLLTALRKKGIRVMDYDNRERALYKIQHVRGALYFLAAEDD